MIKLYASLAAVSSFLRSLAPVPEAWVLWDPLELCSSENFTQHTQPTKWRWMRGGTFLFDEMLIFDKISIAYIRSIKYKYIIIYISSGAQKKTKYWIILIYHIILHLGCINETFMKPKFYQILQLKGIEPRIKPGAGFQPLESLWKIPDFFAGDRPYRLLGGLWGGREADLLTDVVMAFQRRDSYIYIDYIIKQFVYICHCNNVHYSYNYLPRLTTNYTFIILFQVVLSWYVTSTDVRAHEEFWLISWANIQQTLIGSCSFYGNERIGFRLSVLFFFFSKSELLNDVQ